LVSDGSEISESFVEDPRNANLSFLDDKTLDDAVVALRDPTLAGVDTRCRHRPQ